MKVIIPPSLIAAVQQEYGGVLPSWIEVVGIVSPVPPPPPNLRTLVGKNRTAQWKAEKTRWRK